MKIKNFLLGTWFIFMLLMLFLGNFSHKISPEEQAATVIRLLESDNKYQPSSPSTELKKQIEMSFGVRR